MIPYIFPEEKETILRYAKLLSDKQTEEIIARDQLNDRDEALHLAHFFWKMVKASNAEDERAGSKSDFILEKIILTLMAYFRSAGYESDWDEVSDQY